MGYQEGSGDEEVLVHAGFEAQYVVRIALYLFVPQC